MRELGLDWVAQEVDESVRAGELEIRDAPPRQRGLYRDLEIPELASVPSLEAVRTPFGPRAQVHIAAEALRRVVVDAAEMEMEIREELGASIIFAEDDPQTPPETIVRDRTVPPEALHRLRGLLDQLDSEP